MQIIENCGHKLIEITIIIIIIIYKDFYMYNSLMHVSNTDLNKINSRKMKFR